MLQFSQIWNVLKYINNKYNVNVFEFAAFQCTRDNSEETQASSYNSSHLSTADNFWICFNYTMFNIVKSIQYFMLEFLSSYTFFFSQVIFFSNSLFYRYAAIEVEICFLCFLENSFYDKLTSELLVSLKSKAC